MADVYSNASGGVLNFGSFRVEPGGKFKADDVPDGFNVSALVKSGHVRLAPKLKRVRKVKRGDDGI